MATASTAILNNVCFRLLWPLQPNFQEDRFDRSCSLGYNVSAQMITHFTHQTQRLFLKHCTQIGNTKCNMHSPHNQASKQATLSWHPNCTNQGKRNMVHTSFFLVFTHQILNHHLHRSAMQHTTFKVPHIKLVKKAESQLTTRTMLKERGNTNPSSLQ